MQSLGHGLTEAPADPTPLLLLVGGVVVGAAVLGFLLWRRRRGLGRA